MIKNKYLALVLFVLFVLVFWNIFDFIFNFVTGRPYTFEVGDELILPIVVGSLTGGMLFLKEK